MKRLISIFACIIMACCVCSCQGAGGANTGTNSSNSGASQEKIPEKVVLETKQYTMFLEDTETERKISATVYDGEELVENAEVVYEVGNPDVAEVQEDGKIIAKSIGFTEVKVKYGKASATAELRVIGEVETEQVNTFDEKYVNLYGRTYQKGDALHLDYAASGVEVAINGSTLRAVIEASANVYLCVYVDGAETRERIALTSGQNTYTLVSGLEKGFHTIRVVKSSEIYDGQVNIISLRSEGFYSAPEKSSLRIEFVGDSITAGYGALGAKGAARTVENSDACSSYAYYTAQKLGADYSVVAIQGICVKANMWLQECMSDVYKVVSPLNPSAYDFTDKADVVVVNLGTNDAEYILSKDASYSAQFSQDYLALLQYIRAKNPDAYIVCLYGFMGKQSAIDDGIKQAIKACNDKKMVYLEDGFTPDNMGANSHPSKYAQKEWAYTLAEYIQTKIING